MKDRNVKPIGEFSATDSRLLRAALDQDQIAWRELVQGYGGRVYRWVRQAGLQEVDAAEIANQVFVAVARALPDYRPDEKSGSFRRWLRTITYNAVMDWNRVRKRQICNALGGSDNQYLLESQAISSIASSIGGLKAASLEQAAIERVRERTDPTIWRLFWLVSAEQMTPAEVAAECGVSRNVVYITKHRLAKEIREEFVRNMGQDDRSQRIEGSNAHNRPMP